MVCDFASFRGEARSRDSKTLLDYVAYFEEHCKKVAAENGAEVKIIKKESFLPFCIAEDNEVVSVAKAACAKIGCISNPIKVICVLIFQFSNNPGIYFFGFLFI